MKNRAATVNGAFGIVLLRLLEKEGVSGEQLAKRAGVSLEAIKSIDMEITLGDFDTLLEQSIELTARQDLVLQYGQEISVSALGVLGYAFMCSNNIGECLEIFLRYQRLLSPQFKAAKQIDNDRVSLVLEKGFSESAVRQMDTELLFSAATAVIKSLCGQQELNIRAYFSHSKPSYLGTYQKIFGESVVFEATTNRLEMDVSLLEKPLVFADPTMKQVYQQQCEQLLASLEKGKFTTLVQQLLLEKPGHFPNIDFAAERLCLGVRTLRRRLAAEDTSYKVIVQNVRCQLAEEYLRESPLSIIEIADMLGYGDVANFRRAFIGWTALSPAQYRKKYTAKNKPQKHQVK